MKTVCHYLAYAAVLFAAIACKSEKYDVVVVGGGASGCTAGIQAAEMGSRTLIVEELPWLGGMLTSAGVSATDGCYNLPSGLWGEFQKRLAAHYGSMDALRTGWVSNIQFEPSVGNEIFNAMCSEQEMLTVWKESSVAGIRQLEDGSWRLRISRDGRRFRVRARVLIDATELGDIAARCGVPYDIGMESREVTGERIAPAEPNGIIQDLTYVAVLKDYGRDVSIDRPMDYDSTLYACCCANPLCVNPKEPDRIWPADMMLSYGRLPGGKYMINWPIEGNDFYINIIEMSPDERREALKKAKAFTMGFIYFIQHELGYNTLGLADDEFPTGDRLPFIPYHRESRRIHGKVRFTLNHIEKPYDYSLYRTGIAVGDYPVDHHHKRYAGEEELPDLHFFPIPSFTVPLGVMIPENAENLIVAEKSISVSNIANGTTRLQPVVMQIGQAAGALASMMLTDGTGFSVREVQKALLEAGCYLQPFIDVKPDSPLFPAIQRIGSTGILRGEGRQIQWTNVTDLHANDLFERKDLKDLYEYYGIEYKQVEGCGPLSVAELVEMLRAFPGYRDDVDWKAALNDAGLCCGASREEMEKQPVTMAMFAVLTDCLLNPFEAFDVDVYGNVIREAR